jgi:hypothetical protein
MANLAGKALSVIFERVASGDLCLTRALLSQHAPLALRYYQPRLPPSGYRGKGHQLPHERMSVGSVWANIVRSDEETMSSAA